MDQEFLSLTPMRKSFGWSYRDDGNAEIITVKSEAQKALNKFYNDETPSVNFSVNDAVNINLNYTGTKIWELCDGTNTVEDILNNLSQEFNIEKEELVTDINEFFEYCNSVCILNVNWRSIE